MKNPLLCTACPDFRVLKIEGVTFEKEGKKNLLLKFARLNKL